MYGVYWVSIRMGLENKIALTEVTVVRLTDRLLCLERYLLADVKCPQIVGETMHRPWTTNLLSYFLHLSYSTSAYLNLL